MKKKILLFWIPQEENITLKLTPVIIYEIATYHDIELDNFDNNISLPKNREPNRKGL